MKKAPIEKNEKDRLDALLRYQVLDTAEEQIFDDITKLASSICKTPIALVSLVDNDRLWFKSHYGINVSESKRDISFCGHAIHEKKIFEIKDARLDNRFADNPAVTGDFKLRFYAAAPLITLSGHSIGTLCVVGHEPKSLTDDEKNLLEILAKNVVSLFEMRLTNIELAEKNQHLNSLTENMSEGMVLQDNTGKIIEFNSAAMDILGLTADQLLGKTSLEPQWRAIYENGDIYPGHEHPAMITLKTGIPQKNIIMGVPRPSGKISWLSVNTTPIFHKIKKSLTSVLCTFNDVTDEKNLLNELRKSESKFKAFFEHAPLGIVQLNSEMQYLEANQAFQKMVGYSLPELRKVTMFELTHPEDLRVSQTESKKFVDKNFSVIRLRKRYITKNGGVVWGQISSRSVDVSEKSDGHIVTIIEDITEQKEMEENLKSTEIKLIEASKMSALGEMAAGMAHEINNPLSIISAYAAVIRKNIDRDKKSIDLENVKEKLLQIETTVIRIAKIVRGLRTFSRNSSQDPKTPVLISQIIQDTLILCQERFKAKSIELKLNIENDPVLNCTPSQIIQVLMNLLNNAHDAIEKGKNTWIEIISKAENKTLKIIITDSGDGITPAIQEKMMLPFFTTKPVGKGTGLGLSISQGIIEEHGGKLYYDPSSKNTRFIIELPIHEQ